VTAGSPVDLLSTGSVALEELRWADARRAFEAAARERETPEAYEGIGAACYWLEDGPATIAARVHAYRLYRDTADPRGAARVAADLAWDHYFEGERAVADGWVRRAHRLLDGRDPVPERGWLVLLEADMAFFVDHDGPATEAYAATAADLGRSLGDQDLEMAAIAYQGLAWVSQGRVKDGMALLDEATVAAVSGDLAGIGAAATTCCCLIAACEQVRDYGRAGQWCRRAQEVSERWSYQMLFSFCRIHYAGVLVWQGDWRAAEIELLAAVKALSAKPAAASEGLVKLALLRWRQGRDTEAEAFLIRAESPPFRLLAGDLALLARSQIALDSGEPVSAAEFGEQFLRRVAHPGQLVRADALELLVQARLALGDRVAAEAAATELRAVAHAVGTDPLVAAAARAQGWVQAAAGSHDDARRRFEDAVAGFERSGARFEAARTRLDLARSLFALGRSGPAQEQARASWSALRALGAARDAMRAAAELSRLTGAPVGAADHNPAGLTTREMEIVRLAARGLSNQEVASELVLSVRTVERHLSNIYDKLGTRGRTGRAVLATYASAGPPDQLSPARPT
jgi:DNA-binding CsgD family transcriptional regulator